MTALLRRAPARLAIPVLLGAAVLLLLSGPAPAASPFQAGQAGTLRLPVDVPAAASMGSRAAADELRLGFAPAASRRTERVENRFLGLDYLEVTSRDAAGMRTSLTRYGPDGRLLAAITFAPGRPGGTPLAEPAAVRRATTASGAIGVATDGPPTARRAADGGWVVAWPRNAGGHPVRGDGVQVALGPDGAVRHLVRTERTLAPAPVMTIDAGEARRLGTARLDGWLPAADRPLATISDLTLAWIAPNDMFVAAGPDAPAATLRLAWVVEARAAGRLAQRWTALELWLDGGTGALLGGDILR